MRDSIQILSIILLFFLSSLVETQAQNFFPISKGGKYGYMDATGKLVIPLQFDDAKFMEYGVAIVEKEGKKGIIDSLGNIILPFEYKKIKVHFPSVYSTLDFNSKSKIINRKNEVLEENVPYTRTQKVKSNKYLKISRPREKTTTLISSKGEIALKVPYSSILEIGIDTFQVIVSKKIPNMSAPIKFTGWIAKDGSEIIPVKYRQILFMPYQDFISLSGHLDSIALNKAEKKYLANAQGKLLSKKGFNSLRRLSPNFIMTKTGKYGVIDKTGKIILENIFYSISYIKEYELFIGRNAEDGLYRIYDKTGREVSKNVYQDFNYLNNGNALICKDVEQKDGEIKQLSSIISIKDEDKMLLPLVHSCKDLLYIKSDKHFKLLEKNKEGKQFQGILTMDNERIIAPKFQRIEYFEQNYFTIHSGYEVGMINKNNEIIIPLKKQNFERFIKASKLSHFKLFKVKAKTEEGNNYIQLANFSGIIDDAKYSRVYDFDEYGQAKVQGMKQEWGIIDSLGKAILPIGKHNLYRIGNDAVEDIWQVSIIGNGKTKYGSMDRKGNLIIPMEYDNQFFFREGTATVTKNGKTGLINAKNEVLIPVEYESIFPIRGSKIKNQFFMAKNKNTTIVFNSKGKMLTSPDKYIYWTLSKIGWYGVTVDEKIVGYYNPNFEYITIP